MFSKNKTKKSHWFRNCFIITIFVGMCLLWIFLKLLHFSACDGGVDGHTRYLSDDMKEKCIQEFPHYQFPYKQ